MGDNNRKLLDVISMCCCKCQPHRTIIIRIALCEYHLVLLMISVIFQDFLLDDLNFKRRHQIQSTPNDSNLEPISISLGFPTYIYCNFTIANSNLPQTRTNFCSPSGHFLNDFTLNNLNYACQDVTNKQNCRPGHWSRFELSGVDCVPFHIATTTHTQFQSILFILVSFAATHAGVMQRSPSRAAVCSYSVCDKNNQYPISDENGSFINKKPYSLGQQYLFCREPAFSFLHWA